jgi:hypothetical protein
MVMLTDTGGGRDFEPIPAGPHGAICDMLVDLGLQEGGKFGAKHKLYFRFQVPTVRIEWEDKDTGEAKNMPAVIGVQYTASLSEKSLLRPFLESWRGRPFTPEELRGFDPVNVVGIPALINVIHEPGNKNGKAVTYANISSIMPLPQGMPRPQLEGEVVIFDADHQGSFDKLPKWLQEKINNQVREQKPQTVGGGGARPQPAAFDHDLDDDVPF